MQNTNKTVEQAQADHELQRLKDNSVMLGQIAGYVADFCEDSEDTTLMGVMRLLSKCKQLEADKLEQDVYMMSKDNS